MFTYIYIYIYTYIHTYIHIRGGPAGSLQEIYLANGFRMNIYIYICKHTCCMCLCMCVYMYILIYTYTSICICKHNNLIHNIGADMKRSRVG